PAQPAPEVSFTDMAGKPFTLANFRGRLLLVNLWATWCGPCLDEMPSLDRLQANLEEKLLLVVAISEDRGGAKIVEPFLSKLGSKKLRIFLDPKSDVSHAFQVRGLPTTL